MFRKKEKSKSRPKLDDEEVPEDSKTVKVLRAINLFPEYVEHGDFAIVTRGLVKSVLFAVILVSLVSVILVSKLDEPVPSIRWNKDKDPRLGQPTISEYKVIYENVEKNGNLPLTCQCMHSQVQTGGIYREGIPPTATERRALAGEGEAQTHSGGWAAFKRRHRERRLSGGPGLAVDVDFFTLIDECVGGQLQFALLTRYPVAYHQRSGLLNHTAAPCAALGDRNMPTSACAFYTRYRQTRSRCEPKTAGAADCGWNVSSRAACEATVGCAWRSTEWKAADYISLDEFRHEMMADYTKHFEIRNISIRGLCDAAFNLIDKNKDAYLSRFLASPTLMPQNTMESLLKSRFTHMSNLSVSTFNIAFEQDTFRLDFEGVVSQWGKKLNGYLDSLHSANTGAMLEAYHRMVENMWSRIINLREVTGVMWEVDICIREVEARYNRKLGLCQAKSDAASREACKKERAPGFIDIDHEKAWSLKVCRISIAEFESAGFWLPSEVPIAEKKIPMRALPVLTKDEVPGRPAGAAGRMKTVAEHKPAGDYLLPADANSFKREQGDIVFINHLDRDEEGEMVQEGKKRDGFRYEQHGICWQPQAHEVTGSSGQKKKIWYRPTCDGFNLWETPSKTRLFRGWQGFVAAHPRPECVSCCPTFKKFGAPKRDVRTKAAEDQKTLVLDHYASVAQKDGKSQLAVFMDNKCWKQCRHDQDLADASEVDHVSNKKKCEEEALYDKKKCEETYHKHGCYWAGVGDHVLSKKEATGSGSEAANAQCMRADEFDETGATGADRDANIVACHQATGDGTLGQGKACANNKNKGCYWNSHATSRKCEHDAAFAESVALSNKTKCVWAMENLRDSVLGLAVSCDQVSGCAFTTQAPFECKSTGSKSDANCVAESALVRETAQATAQAKCRSEEFQKAGCYWSADVITDSTWANMHKAEPLNASNPNWANSATLHPEAKRKGRAWWNWLRCCPKPVTPNDDTDMEVDDDALWYDKGEHTQSLPWNDRLMDNWWTGELPAKRKVGAPSGKQLLAFTGAVLKYQAFCARNNLPSMPLYDATAPRRPKPGGTGAFPPAAHSEKKMKRWMTDLFKQWATGALPLALEGGRVPFDTKEDNTDCYSTTNSSCEDYGRGRDICARLPSVVNYVSECDCYAEPMCMSSIEHKYTFFVGTARIVEERDLRTPVPITCSYFRQLEVLADPGKAIKGYTPYTDITLRHYCGTKEHKLVPQCPPGYDGGGHTCIKHQCQKSSGALCSSAGSNAPVLTKTGCDKQPGCAWTMFPEDAKEVTCPDGSTPSTMPMQLGFDISLHDISNYSKTHGSAAIPAPFDLRTALQNAFVKRWNDNLDEHLQRIFQAYFERCKPTDCYYDQPQGNDIATIVTIFLGIVGGLVSLVKTGVSSVVDAITGIFFGTKRLDVVELHDEHAGEASKVAERQRKIERAERIVARRQQKATGAAPDGATATSIQDHSELVATLVPATLSMRPSKITEV